ncbi:hypothetical protein GCM10010440_03580 [Kitasatospora cinereorecta]
MRSQQTSSGEHDGVDADDDGGGQDGGGEPPHGTQDSHVALLDQTPRRMVASEYGSSQARITEESRLITGR